MKFDGPASHKFTTFELNLIDAEDSKIGLPPSLVEKGMARKKDGTGLLNDSLKEKKGMAQEGIDN